MSGVFRHFPALIITFLAWTGLAAAQSPNFQPVELTQQGAAGAIEAMPAIYQVAQSYEGSVGRGSGDDPIDGFAALATYAAARAELDASVAQYGFSSYQDWVAIIQTVMHTYAYSQSAGAMQQAAPALDMAMQQMMNNPNIPQAQKDALMAQFGGGGPMAMMQANAPSPGNLAVVGALGPQIQQMINFMQSQP
ncbi:MAG: hypothetical protein HKN60_07405 [Rhizobiales bacterium]|nr:hypothetical protein [Hyphomicrobiales bacterium]